MSNSVLCPIQLGDSLSRDRTRTGNLSNPSEVTLIYGTFLIFNIFIKEGLQAISAFFALRFNHLNYPFAKGRTRTGATALN